MSEITPISPAIAVNRVNRKRRDDARQSKHAHHKEPDKSVDEQADKDSRVINHIDEVV